MDRYELEDDFSEFTDTIERLEEGLIVRPGMSRPEVWSLVGNSDILIQEASKKIMQISFLKILETNKIKEFESELRETYPKKTKKEFELFPEYRDMQMKVEWMEVMLERLVSLTGDIKQSRMCYQKLIEKEF